MGSFVRMGDVLYNYDTDRDTFPGLVIARGGNGPNEADPTKYQVWRSTVFDEAVVVQGEVMVKLWCGMKDFDDTKGGAVTVYLLDFDGSGYVELGSDTVADPTWQGGNPSWGQETFQFSIGPHTIAPGHSLDLKVIVEDSSDDDMWFAYDAANYNSRVNFPD